MTTKQNKPKKQSKGKQHPLRAESLDRLASRIEESSTDGIYLSKYRLAQILREEAKYVRSILR